MTVSLAESQILPPLSERLRDAVLRLPLGGFYLYFGVQRAVHLVQGAPGLATLDAADMASYLAGAGTTLFMLVVALAVLLRRRRVAATPGLYAKLVAIAGTFFILPIVWLPAYANPPLALSLIESGLMLGGSLLGAAVAFWLGRSFSIMPEARRLVTHGPYRLVRHPLYVVEEIVIIGVLLQVALPWSLLLLAGHLVLQLERMRLEEAVLTRAFPEYTAYAARTARLIPGIY